MNRYEGQVLRTDGCWIWTGTKARYGYGRPMIDGRRVFAHRYAYEQEHGPIPEGMFVCHHCDNPSCVRPDHLFLGTAGDNNRDRHAKGRTVVPDTRGERHGMARLTADQVRQIRITYSKGGTSQRVLAEYYGVAQATISRVTTGSGWAPIGDTP